MVIHIRFMYVGGYRHNFEGLCEKFNYPIFINKERTLITQVGHASLM